MPSDRNGIIEMYLNDPRARKYLEMDRELNNGYDPERTTLLENVCFCLVKPKYDQCADPIYTQVSVNLKKWHEERQRWHSAGASKCAGTDCACNTSSGWFLGFTQSEARAL